MQQMGSEVHHDKEGEGEEEGRGGEKNEGDVIDQEILDYEEQLQTLRAKLNTVRKRRAQILNTKTHMQNLHTEWMIRKNKAMHNKALATADLESIITGQITVEDQLKRIRQMNALNDCFHIWHRGPFGTINGLRLGRYYPPVSSAAVYPEETYDYLNGNGGSASAVAGFGMLDSSFDRSISNLFLDPSSFTFGLCTENEMDGNITTTPGYYNDSNSKVPWSEVNAALGLVALLLSTIESNPNSGIQFTAYDIVPLGSFSKIVTRVKSSSAGTHTAGTVYTLYSDDSFSLFGKRSFNGALNGLLKCLADAGTVVAKRDKTMEFPHPIAENSRGELAISGLPLTFGTDGERWTRAFKYFLTDLKWLVAFMTKHVDT